VPLAVIPLVAFGSSALIKLLGKPVPPKPPNMIRATSRISATAEYRLSELLVLIARRILAEAVQLCSVRLTAERQGRNNSLLAPRGSRRLTWFDMVSER